MTYVRYLTGVAMLAGHDPRSAREYRLDDLELLAALYEMTHGRV